MSADTFSAAPAKGKARRIAFLISTGLFSAMMALSAFAYLTQPMMAQAFIHLGFPAYFRVELAIAKLLGIAALLAPVPSRVKEWAYAGFGITFISAVIAHSSVDGPATAVAPVVAFALLATSYLTSPGSAR